jgi:hypothetical protein
MLSPINLFIMVKKQWRPLEIYRIILEKRGINKCDNSSSQRKAGVSSSTTIEFEVLVLYTPPAELVTTLTSNSSRRWRIKAEEAPFWIRPCGWCGNC